MYTVKKPSGQPRFVFFPVSDDRKSHHQHRMKKSDDQEYFFCQLCGKIFSDLLDGNFKSGVSGNYSPEP
jgi:hypothetical protein